MGNAIKFGLIIGILSGIWILILHLAGVYETSQGNGNFALLEYASILIPFIGLFFGIKNFRDNINGGKMEFFEGLFEGFKIMIVGGVIAAFCAVVYVQYSPSVLNTDYMGRIGGAGIVGILFNLAISISLMNKQKYL
ncbi:MAG: DUF4199 domain-containing protein [Flavobacterium sp.]|nr:DUF4199 domain-containing protein [Pedobacter sp.]